MVEYLPWHFIFLVICVEDRQYIVILLVEPSLFKRLHAQILISAAYIISWNFVHRNLSENYKKIFFIHFIFQTLGEITLWSWVYNHGRHIDTLGRIVCWWLFSWFGGLYLFIFDVQQKKKTYVKRCKAIREGILWGLIIMDYISVFWEIFWYYFSMSFLKFSLCFSLPLDGQYIHVYHVPSLI